MLLGDAPSMTEVRRLVERAGRALSTVLVVGETGVGKELVAREIHAGEATRGAPWVAVNCAALPAELVESLLFGHEKGAFTGAQRASRGKFREANGGTLFLDEVGELSLPVQAKLLRVLQEREVEPLGGVAETIRLRVVVATHRDLREEVAARRFREDLFYRLSVVTVHVPPLRERSEDIPKLFHFLLKKVGDRIGLPPPSVREELIDYLASCSWPGNVRQLENLLEEMLVLHEAGPMGLPSLPRSFHKETFLEDFLLPPTVSPPEETTSSGQRESSAPAPWLAEGVGEELKDRLDACERYFLLEALAVSRGKKKLAAEALGISARAMSYYVKKHAL
jgi:transcriptional regulator with PAS, ATPase and Fis domain